MHVTPNVAMKAVKSTERGHRALAGTFSAGVKHGRNGKMLHPNAKSFLEYGVGPESLIDYNIGKRVGSGLKKYDGKPERQATLMRRLSGQVGLDDVGQEGLEALKHTPLLSSIHRHLNNGGSKRVEKIFDRFSVDETTQLTKGQKAGNMAMLAGAGAVDPHLLLQPAFSGLRKTLAKTDTGKRLMKNNFNKALDGKEIPKWKERVIDTVVSPGVLDTHRLGKFIGKNYDQDVVESVKGMANKAVPDPWPL